MQYWVKTFRNTTYHMFDIEPGEEHLVELFAPCPKIVEWMTEEGFPPEKLTYRSKPQPGFMTTDDALARVMHNRWA